MSSSTKEKVNEKVTVASYVPPKVWKHNEGDKNGGAFSSINRPFSGSRFNRDLPIGKHPFQLYSLGTPNGQKVTIMLEELLSANGPAAEYDAHFIDIGEGDQFGSGFVSVNPNSKIPALVDRSGSSSEGSSSRSEPINVFESGNIVLYLSEKFDNFLCPSSNRTEIMNWLFWLQGSAPFLGGGFGHFFNYAPEKFQYPIDRYTMETKRQLDVLDKRLQNNRYLAGNDYSIADVVAWPWYGLLVLDGLYPSAAEFLNVAEYEHVLRWSRDVANRPAVRRGRIVNKTWGEKWDQLRERHSSSDIDAVLSLKP